MQDTQEQNTTDFQESPEDRAKREAKEKKRETALRNLKGAGSKGRALNQIVDLYILERAIVSGLSDKQIAFMLDIPERTWYRIKKRADVQAVIKEATGKATQIVVGSVILRATGYFVEEIDEKLDKLDRVVQLRKRKYIIPSDIAAIFYLTNRDNENWKHKTATEQLGAIIHKIEGIPEGADKLMVLRKQLQEAKEGKGKN